jgi:hypothetical protein
MEEETGFMSSARNFLIRVICLFNDVFSSSRLHSTELFDDK